MSAGSGKDQQASSVRPGADVPGYQGHIGGKAAEPEVVGGTFRVVNEQAAMKTARAKVGAAPSAIAADGWSPRKARSSPRSGPPGCSSARSADGAIPGYSGHLPGKVEHVYGATFSVANANAVAERLGEVRVGDYPTHDRGPPQVEAAVGTGQAVRAIPGYHGHVPGKFAENVLGATWAPANSRAAEHFTTIVKGPPPHTWRRVSAPGVASRRGSGFAPGREVPGYTGFTGTKASGHIYGKTFRAANEEANTAVKTARGRRERHASAPQTARHPGTAPGSGGGRSQRSASGATSARGSTAASSSKVAPLSSRAAAPRIPGYSGHVPLHW